MQGNDYKIEDISSSPLVAIDIETTGLNRRDEIVSAAVTWTNSNFELKSVAFYLDRCAQENIQEDDDKFQEILKATLFDNEKKTGYKGIVLFHNLLFDLKLILVRYRELLNEESLKYINEKNMPFTRYRFLSSDICKVSDTATMSRLLKSTKFLSHIDPNKFSCHSLKFLAKEYFPKEYTDDPNDKDPKKKKVTSFDDATSGANIRLAAKSNRIKLLDYNMEDTELTLRLYVTLKEKMTKNEWEYFEKYEIAHSMNLFHLAWYGVPFDSEKAEELTNKMYHAKEILEDEIHKDVGNNFNIDSQQQLAKNIFYNSKITYQHPEENYPEPISPFGVSDSGNIKIDSDSLKALQARIRKWDQTSKFIPLVDKLIAYLELSKNISKIENMEKYVVVDEGEEMIFPNISATTKSGRVSCSGPNVLGLPKGVFKKSDFIPSVEVDGDDPGKLEKLWESLKSESVRQLIKAPDGYKMARIDISGLDLVVIAHGAKKFSRDNEEFYWLKFLKKYKGADTHFSILQALKIKENPIEELDMFSKAFQPFCKELKDDLDNYLAMKPSEEIHEGIKKSGIRFIHLDTKESEFVPYPNDNGSTKEELKRLRDFSKKLNLATSYLMGYVGLAIDLSEVMEKTYSHSSAKEVLDRFYEVFYEIRAFQDEVSNQVYENGYMTSPFGRRFYAETWDDLNEHHKNYQKEEYELIIKDGDERWYLRALGWEKYNTPESPLIKDMKITEKPFGLRFDKILAYEKLPSGIFRKKEKRVKKSRFNRKSENNLDEQLKYELSRIEITSEIDKEIQLGFSMGDEKRKNLNERKDGDGFYLFREKEIELYRLKSLPNPASRFFKVYKKLDRAIKVFFPMYCQGVANTIAMTVLTRVRERFENELPEARVLFFIHDEVVAIVPEKKEELAKEILEEAVENEDIKKPFDLPFTGEFEWRDTFAE